MAMFKVSPQQLRQKVQELQRMEREFKQAVDSLVQKEAALASTWEGDAQIAFRNAFRNDRQQFENFRMGLQKYVQVLQEALRQYEAAESRNTDIARTRKA